ncbi:MAG: hypothetical protein ACRDE6_02095 [Candidatus Limnocylindria bacterium]
MARDRAPLLLLAATLVVIVVAGVALGTGLVKLSQTIEASPSASAEPTSSAVAQTSPNASAIPSAAPSAPANEVIGRVLHAAADGLRLRTEASASGEIVATLRAGQRMGIVSGPIAAEGMDWYEVRIGPGDLAGWVASGADGSWVRLVNDGAVAFARSASGRSSVALVTPQGDDAIATLREGAFLREWTWSPDGSRLAATIGDTGDSMEAVLIMEPDGTVIERLDAGMGPAWSPDGSRLAWVDFEGRIVVTDESLEPAALLDAGRSPHAIAWSPDGSRLAYLAADCPECPPDEPILGDPPIAVFTIAVDGSDRRQLTSSSIDGLPSWSADGARIAFLRFDLSGEFPTRLLVVDADGGEPRELVDGAAITGGGGWSPDGSRLALATSEGILIASPDGAAELMVASDEETLITELQWSPSGRYLVYGTSGSSTPDTSLWIVEADGSGEPRQISPSGEGAAQAKWQPVLVAP